MMNPSRRTALILSGGGARGAYEVGVLWYIFDELARTRGGPPQLDIISGTSVGAINGCYLAAHLSDPVLGLRRLVQMWDELEVSKVLGFGMRQVVGLPKLLLGGGKEGAGLFDVTPMAEIVTREISWRAVFRTLRKGQLRALTVSTTEVTTGRTVVFMQTAPDVVVPRNAPPRTLFRNATIGPEHALASAAIPLLFPPVRIEGNLYLDGGLRQNTPIAPALRLGATHVLAIGSSREVKGIVASAECIFARPH
jgi:NTE family protein